MGGSGEAGRSSASRLLAVLGAFSRRRPIMNLTQLSTASGLPIATTYRMVKELIEWGGLERNPDGTLQIGLRLWEVGGLAPRQRDLRGTARPVLESLHEGTGELVQLAVLQADRVLIVDKVSGTHSVNNVTELARPLPLHATGVGKIFLAFGPPALMERLHGRDVVQFTDRTRSFEEITAETEQIKADMVAYCREELTRGTCSVAAPVFDSDGGLVAALGILTGPGTSLRRIAPAVMTAAATLSRRFGYTGTPPRAAS